MTECSRKFFLAKGSMWGKTEYMHITILRQHLHERPDDTFLRTEK